MVREKDRLFVCVCACVCLFPAGSVSPLGQAVLPVQPAGFLLRVAIRLEKTLKLLMTAMECRKCFVLMLSASEQRPRLKGSERDAPPCRAPRWRGG